MSGRIAIIIESSNVAGKTDLPGARKDARDWELFLRSDLGGAWNDNEVQVFHKPSISDIAKLMNEHLSDYVFLAFSGHGKSVNGETYVCLNDTEQHVSVKRLTATYFGTSIFDCCRWHPPAAIGFALDQGLLKEGTSMESFAVCNSLDRMKDRARLCDRLRDRKRHAFDDALNKAGKYPVKMFSCWDGEEAGEGEENEEAGGYYTTLLLESAKEWERNTAGKYSEYITYSTRQAHDSACQKMQELNPQQHPQYIADAFNQHYPFAVR